MDLHPLQTDGYLHIPGLLDPSDLASLSAGFDRLESIAEGLADTAEVGGSQFVVSQDPFALRRVVWCGGASPELAAFGSDPRFLDVAAQVLGRDEVVQLIQQAHFKRPGDGVDFAWHQDASNRRYGSDLWTDINGQGSFVQILVALDPAGPDNGGVAVVPGSHSMGFVSDPVTGAVPPELLDLDRAVTPALNAGDALLFGPFLLHGSPANHGRSMRRTFIQGYALPGANRRVYPGCGTGVVRRR
ncbi:MAG: phytanoyl-CoA dioxygenase family protein [Myxococcota bacterium]